MTTLFSFAPRSKILARLKLKRIVLQKKGDVRDSSYKQQRLAERPKRKEKTRNRKGLSQTGHHRHGAASLGGNER